MPALPLTTFLDALRDSAILSPAQQSEVVKLQSRCPDPRALAKQLLQRGWLTPYQVNQLFAGRGSELVMGGYCVLERLGEGGTGQVFKARHRRLERTVALKLIRPELLADPEVVARFYREVQVLSQMSHPNVVHAYDAGPLGPAHFLVMEYVEGTDLSALVQQQGPLAWERACDCIAQAARGLQHAHERGLVHRDIKPSNLLLASGGRKPPEENTSEPALSSGGLRPPLAGGVVKVLDLGLARLGKGAADGEVTQMLTVVGSGAVTMGTPDYLAPEQAINFHKVDIRGDIYGLGCTLFFLLTGKPPFPGGTLAQKLMSHQQAAAPLLKESRADLPAALQPIVRRMMAKRPEDRYQTPAEVAAALEALAAGSATTLAWPRRATQFLADGRGQRRLLVAGVLILLLVGGFLLRGQFSGRSKSPDSTGTVAGNGSATAASVPANPNQDRKLAGLIGPAQGEDKWAQVPWMTNLWEARLKAAHDGKPILLWETDGHPLGTTCGSGIGARVGAFADADIIRMATNDFVPVTGDDWYQRRRTDAEGVFFQNVANQGPRKGPSSRQGIYCLTAAGKFLAYGNAGHNVDSTRQMLARGLTEWKALPEDQRKPGAVTVGPHGFYDSRFRRVRPAGGRILNVYTRILERDAGGEWRRGTTTATGGAQAARDHLWMTADEQKALMAERPTVPASLARRIARFHLVDNTRGEPVLWTDDEVRSLSMTLTVMETTPTQVRMRLEGSALLTNHPDAARADRGFEVRLFGGVCCNGERTFLTQFDVVAVGDHWGDGSFSSGARPGRAPLGVVFGLVPGGAPGDIVPPAGARDPGEYFGAGSGK